MRRLLLIIFVGVMAGPLPAAVPVLLESALEKISADYDHWAYTQTTVERNEKGKILKEVVVRFDPSKPYAEQYTPLTINGQAPTAADLKKFRKQGERRGAKIAEAENEGTKRRRVDEDDERQQHGGGRDHDANESAGHPSSW